MPIHGANAWQGKLFINQSKLLHALQAFSTKDIPTAFLGCDITFG